MMLKIQEGIAMAERDYLEQNIERLFHSVEPELKLPEPERGRLLKALIDEGANLGGAAAHASSSKITQARPNPRPSQLPNPPGDRTGFSGCLSQLMQSGEVA